MKHGVAETIVAAIAAGRLAVFGERGVVDLTAVNGCYALLAMQMNVMRTPPVSGGPVLPRRDDN